MKVAVLKGGASLERTVSLRSGARVEDALARLGHEVLPIDVGADLVDRLIAERPDVAFVALHGRGGEDGTVQELLELVGVPYTASRPGRLHPLHGQGRGQARAARRRHPDAGLLRVLARPRSRSSARRARCRRSRSGWTSRSSSSPPARARRSGSSSRARPPTCPNALVAAFSYDTKVLLERYVAGRDLAVSVLESADGPEALPVVEAIPMEEDFYDFEARYEIGRTRFVCPADLSPELTRGRRSSRWRPGRRSAARASRGWT